MQGLQFRQAWVCKQNICLHEKVHTTDMTIEQSKCEAVQTFPVLPTTHGRCSGCNWSGYHNTMC